MSLDTTSCAFCINACTTLRRRGEEETGETGEIGKSEGKDEDGKEPEKEGTFAATGFTRLQHILPR